MMKPILKIIKEHVPIEYRNFIKQIVDENLQNSVFVNFFISCQKYLARTKNE